jgi:hypothetical protein
VGQEERLAGGFITNVVRIGDTVRRKPGLWSPAVHAVLGHLEAVGFGGAPRFLGVDDEGREMLSFVEGHVPTGANPEQVTDLAIQDVGRLIQALHTATTTFQLPPGVVWHFRPLDGPPPHVVCHHDLSPRNTVFNNGRVVAFIDWDMATLEAPIHDLTHAAWQFVPLVSDRSCRSQGWTSLPDRARRLTLLLDAYGLAARERIGFVEQVAERMEVSATGIEMMAEQGMPAFQRLVEIGAPATIRLDRQWVLAHRDELQTAIQA